MNLTAEKYGLNGLPNIWVSYKPQSTICGTQNYFIIFSLINNIYGGYILGLLISYLSCICPLPGSILREIRVKLNYFSLTVHMKGNMAGTYCTNLP